MNPMQKPTLPFASPLPRRIDAFSNIIDIGPIVSPTSPDRDRLASVLALAPEERTVLVGFGGIPLTSLPLEQIGTTAPLSVSSSMAQFHRAYSRIHSTDSLPFSFKTLLASVDVIMTKPGYGTIVEAVALQQPIVYVRRYNFADEQPLVDYLHRYGRGIELSIDDFMQGRWEPALRKVVDLPMPAVPPPLTSGAADAATILAKLL